MGLFIPTHKEYTAQELADRVLEDDFTEYGGLRFDVEFEGMKPKDQEEFIQLSVENRVLRQKVDQVIEMTYESSVPTGRDNFDKFIAKRDEVLSVYLTEIRDLGNDPQHHLMACDPSHWLGKIHSQDAFCEDPGERSYYKECVNEIIDKIYDILPQELIKSHGIKKADIPKDRIEQAVIEGSWNADYLTLIDFYGTTDSTSVLINLVFKEDATGESLPLTLTI